MKDINLMPEDIKPIPAPKTQFSKVRKKVLVIPIIGFILIFGSIIVPKIYVAKLEHYSSRIQADIDSEKFSEVKNVNQKISSVQVVSSVKNEVINKINKEHIKVSDIINYAQEALPLGVAIESLQVNNKNLSISGTAKDSTAVAEYISNLTRLNALTDYTSKATFSYDEAKVKLNYKLDLSQE